MSEIATSIMNKNSLLYGKEMRHKNAGPDCVDGKGKVVKPIESKPEKAPVLAVRER